MTERLAEHVGLTKQVARSRTYICKSRGVGLVPNTVVFWLKRSVANL